MSELPTGAPLPVAIGAGAGLTIVASALIVAAVNPTLDGRIIAGFAGVVIAMIGLGTSIAIALLRTMALPRTNDDWTYW
jgi:hypothetical protein